MIDWITRHTEEAEEVVDVLTNSIGVIITKSTPLLAPLASGFTVLFAFYDGGGRIMKGTVEYPYAWSFGIGFILMIALEGINFSTTFNRDRAARLKEIHVKELGNVKADALVSYAFWLTVALIFGLETLPGGVGFYQGTVTGSDLAFKCGLLLLPFFSKIGARVFSLSLILDNLEGLQEARRNRRQQVKRQEAEFTLEMEIMRQEAALKLAQTEAGNKQRLEIERLKVEAKLQNKSVNRHDSEGKSDSLNHESKENSESRIIDYYRNNPLSSQRKTAGDLDLSQSKVNRILSDLESRKVIHRNGNGVEILSN